MEDFDYCTSTDFHTTQSSTSATKTSSAAVAHQQALLSQYCSFNLSNTQLHHHLQQQQQQHHHLNLSESLLNKKIKQNLNDSLDSTISTVSTTTPTSTSSNNKSSSKLVNKEDDDNTISTTTSNVNIDIVNAVRSICGVQQQNRNNNNNNSTNNSSTNSPSSTGSSLNNNTDQDTNDTSRVLNNYSLEDPTFGSNLINLPLEQLYKSANNNSGNNNNLMLIHQNITLPNLNINQATNALNGNFSNFGYNLGDKIFDKKGEIFWF